MSTVNAPSPDVDAPDDETEWILGLTSPGPSGDAAQRDLHALLLRATRRQVWRLRDRLPGAGAVELEDLAQQSADDALVAVLNKLHTFEGRSKFSTWVYKFGVLTAGVAVRRQAWRHREIPLPDTLTIVDPAVPPADRAEGTDLVRAIQRAIDEDLTPHQRRVALALIVQDVPIDVLADRLNTNRNALYKTLHDARQRLRASLSSRGYLDDTSIRSTR